PFADSMELQLQERFQSPGHRRQRARARHDHAEGPQSQAPGHGLAQVRKTLVNRIVPLVHSRKAGHGSSVSGNACDTSAYQNYASLLFSSLAKNLHLKGLAGRVLAVKAYKNRGFSSLTPLPAISLRGLEGRS